MKTPATTVRTTFTAVSDEACSSTACEARAPMGKAHERATTAAVSERRELAPRRAIATVKAATSCSAQTVMGTAVAASTDVEGADASTIPSIMACIIHALTRRVTAHVRCHRAGCHNRVRAGSSSLPGSLSKLAAAAVHVRYDEDGGSEQVPKGDGPEDSAARVRRPDATRTLHRVLMRAICGGGTAAAVQGITTLLCLLRPLQSVARPER